jgi:hypothetical protein
MLVKVMLLSLETFVNIVSALQYILSYFVTIVSRVCTMHNKNKGFSMKLQVYLCLAE